MNIDGHKLHFHPDVVSKIIAAEKDPSKLQQVPPIYVEISPVGACNHRCTFCAVDYIGYDAHNRLKKEDLISVIEDMGKIGVKSIMFAGEGEPLLHSSMAEIVGAARRSMIDVAFTTNAVPLTKKFVDSALDKISWIKVSLNAGSPSTYSKVHRTREKDFQIVIDNLKYAVKFKKENNLSVKIGVQSILLPENKHEMYDLAKMVRDEIGVDYFVVKPFSQEPSSINTQYIDINYMSDSLRSEEESICSLSNDNFNVEYRSETMLNYHEDSDRRYTTCYSTPIVMAYLMANGDIYGCKDHLLDPKFCYGNILNNSFKEIWHGKKRFDSLSYVLNDLDVSNCRVNCRLDKVNRFLADLIDDKVLHKNFI